MALAPMHRHATRDSIDTDNYAIADVRLAMPEGSAIEGVAGSVTSFVRKLFQMVQGECDSVVGFVADGTAFEVKDPRRLEQDILPKYFRHSRFQSLVRQLNFYSFKKISKERSVWIYKHAFFRRDEPELLHALKRKTNQHGARIGVVGPDVDDEMVEQPPRVVTSSPRSFPRDPGPRDNAPRLRGAGACLARNQANGFAMQHSAPSPFGVNSLPESRLPSHLVGGPQTSNNSASKGNRSPESRPVIAGTKLLQSHSRSAGGGPSTGGVGGPAAPCHGGRGPSSHMPGFAWSGAGGQPVGAGDEYNYGGDRGSTHAFRALSQHDACASSSHAYRQGPAIGDAGGDGDASALGISKRGVKRGGGGAAAAGSGSSPVAAEDRQQALALWGLSALCQVASATAAKGDEGETASVPAPAPRQQQQPRTDDAADHWDMNNIRRDGGGGGHFSVSQSDALSPRGGSREDEYPHKRPCNRLARVDTEVVADGGGGGGGGGGLRRGWRGIVGDSRNKESSEAEADEDDQDGVTSGERDDSMVSGRNRSGSCGSYTSSTNSKISSVSAHGISPPNSPSGAVITAGALEISAEHCNSHRQDVLLATNSGGDTAAKFTGVNDTSGFGLPPVSCRSGSGGVFCPTWDWGRAASRPAVDMFGSSFVDRRSAMARQEEEQEDEHEEDDAVGEMEESFSFVEQACPPASLAPRDGEADKQAEASVGLKGIGALLDQVRNKSHKISSSSVYLALVSNGGDEGLREMAVFCAGSAGCEPDTTSSPTSLARKVSAFLESEEAVAYDLRVYAEALDPAASDVVGRCSSCVSSSSSSPVATDAAALKLLRIFCRYAACRLGRAFEVVSAIVATDNSSRSTATARGGGVVSPEQQATARSLGSLLDSYRLKWWRAAVRFS